MINLTKAIFSGRYFCRSGYNLEFNKEHGEWRMEKQYVAPYGCLPENWSLKNLMSKYPYAFKQIMHKDAFLLFT